MVMANHVITSYASSVANGATVLSSAWTRNPNKCLKIMLYLENRLGGQPRAETLRGPPWLGRAARKFCDLGDQKQPDFMQRLRRVHWP